MSNYSFWAEFLLKSKKVFKFIFLTPLPDHNLGMDKAFLEYPLHKFHCDRQDIFSMWPTLPFIYIKHNYPNLITFFVNKYRSCSGIFRNYRVLHDSWNTNQQNRTSFTKCSIWSKCVIKIMVTITRKKTHQCRGVFRPLSNIWWRFFVKIVNGFRHKTLS